ncbi:zinc-binding dehydrogenase [Leucobacter ruminantium]|uniref:Zinc-binding dehydrogenase n=1 Tax=Leucobacter ruminantium TaxID=1289170 RepID=A0A939M1Q8_9MICO|nr:zinc-binding dehydrogenase [Leucobacter ruminantium]MBO1806417.1 zinc-binding dehydrogenase [Leucobacter ruminantium]
MTRTKILGAVLAKPQEPLGIHELLIDEPLPGEVRLRILAAGLCHSDLHYLDGTLPIDLPAVLGHELMGEIVAVGDADAVDRIGERAVVTITPSCGICDQCSAGFSTRCTRVTRRRYRSRPKVVTKHGEPVNLLGSIGGFAEQVIVPAAAAIPVPVDLSPSAGCLLGCCIATGFGAVVHGASVSPLDTVAVIGCGGVGIAALQAARISGARQVIAIDVHEEKLERARNFGATDALLSGSDIIEQVQKVCPGGVTKSFEAVGSPATADLSFEILSAGGVATVLGLERPGSRISLDAALLIEGDRRIQGAYMGSNQMARDVLGYVDHYRSGALELDQMVTSRWKFEQINEGFAAMREPGAIRSVVEFI